MVAEGTSFVGVNEVIFGGYRDHSFLQMVAQAVRLMLCVPRRGIEVQIFDLGSGQQEKRLNFEKRSYVPVLKILCQSDQE